MNKNKVDNLLLAPYPWQANQWQHLLQRIRKNNLPHALLLCGAPGLGKKQFAKEFAKFIFCSQHTEQDSPCQQCRACQLIVAESHPDLYLIEPEAEGKAIRIDQVRELSLQLTQTAQQGDYKIAILTPADSLNIAGANALLKTLEEPGGKTLLILVTELLTSLPATIRSRCQIVNFYPPSMNVTRQWLQSHLPSNADSELLTRIAEAAPLQALAFADNNYLEQRCKLLQALKNIAQQGADPVQQAGQWLKFSIEILMTWLMSVSMDIIRIQAGLPLTEVTNSDETNFLQQMAKIIVRSNTFLFLEQLYKIRHQFDRSNPNQQLVLENLFCLWHEYTQTK